MKTLIRFSVLIAALSIGSMAVAGPGPGQPGLGERSGEIARERTHDLGSNAQPYALTGDEGSRCDEPTSLSISDRRRCDPRTSVSHRRQGGGTH